MTKSKPPLGGSFTATSTLSEGTTIAPGETVTETVAFSPTAPGGATGVWALNGTDTSGLHEIKFTGNGTVPAPGPGWSHNGSATITSGVVQTTAAVSNQAGSAFYETPLESKHLVVEFDQTINGGSGADGQTLTFADATKASPSALGEQGGGLGFAGISGVAVGFDTYKNSANPSNNFAGISNGAGTTAGTLNWLATSTTIPALRTATRHVKVETLNGTVSVWVEGTKYLSTAVTLPAKVLVGFTGGTGGSNDIHKAANVTISGEPVAEKPKEEPPAATLKITDAISAPSGSPQAETTLTYSGTLPLQLHDRRARQRRLRHADAHRRRPGRRLLGRRDRAHRHRLEDHRLGQRRRPRRNRRLRRQSHRPQLHPRRRRQHRRVHEHLHRAERRTAGGDAEDHERDQRAERLPAGGNDAHLQRHLPLQLHDRGARQRRLRHADAHRRRPGRCLLGRRDRAHRHRLEDHRLGQRRRPRRNRRLRRQSHRPQLRPRGRRQHRRVRQHLHGAERRNRRSHDPRPERRRLAAQRQRTARKPEPRAHGSRRRIRRAAPSGRPRSTRATSPTNSRSRSAAAAAPTGSPS